MHKKSRRGAGTTERVEVLKTLHSTFRKLLEEQKRSKHGVKRKEIEKQEPIEEKGHKEKTIQRETITVQKAKVTPLQKEVTVQSVIQDEPVIPVKRKRGRPRKSEAKSRLEHNSGVVQKNGIIYIRSKERALIPNLSADEALRRHKQADENMRRAWTSIIRKYENVNDDAEGDLVDLGTGKIVRDNGHLRRLSLMPSIRDPETEYKTTLGDLFVGVDGTELSGQQQQQQQQVELGDGYSVPKEGGEEGDEYRGSVSLDRKTDRIDLSLSSSDSYESSLDFSEDE